jgi:5-formyltetrahydrofolate cyclo-ligase
VPRRRLTPISAQWLDLIVVPSVGVDGEGRRLGMGAGYYDRALAFRQPRRRWKGPHLVGLAFDCQRTNVKFADAWDLRLDSLATESGVEHYL